MLLGIWLSSTEIIYPSWRKVRLGVWRVERETPLTSRHWTGFQETRRYLPDSVITSFLDRAIRNRITLRLLAEHHLSLSSASLATLTPSAIPSSPSPSPSPKDPRVEPSARPPSNSLAPSRVGVLDLALSPNALIDSCAKYVSDLCEATYGVAPKYRIEGATEATIGGIGVHLEYVMTELLKNAFRATIESNTPKKEEPDPGVFRFEDLPSAHMSPEDFPEIVVTIAVAPGILTIRVRDRGGGISALLLLCPKNLFCCFRTDWWCVFFAFLQSPRISRTCGPTPSRPCHQCPILTPIPTLRALTFTAAQAVRATMVELEEAQGEETRCSRRVWAHSRGLVLGESCARSQFHGTTLMGRA